MVSVFFRLQFVWELGIINLGSRPIVARAQEEIAAVPEDRPPIHCSKRDSLVTIPLTGEGVRRWL